jgi:hypothetical protein
MKQLIFYHQKRRDGGLRTGVEVNDEPVLEEFKLGRQPEDSRLLWFIDVRSIGTKVPTQPEPVRRWLLQIGPSVRTALRELAEEIRAGIDSDWPVKKDVPSPQGTKTAIYCSAMRRMDGRKIVHVISELQENWDQVIQQLPCIEYSIH